MANTSKQSPLTAETFEKLFMPVINKQFKEMRNDLTNVVHTVNTLTEIVQETNERAKHLPTTEVYLAS